MTFSNYEKKKEYWPRPHENRLIQEMPIEKESLDEDRVGFEEESFTWKHIMKNIMENI